MQNQTGKKLSSTVIIDTEQALEILHKAGPEALAIHLVLVAHQGDVITFEALEEFCNMPRPTIERACYQLGLVHLGVIE